jgi:hypothetical protein
MSSAALSFQPTVWTWGLIHSRARGGSLTAAQASIRKASTDFDIAHLADRGRLDQLLSQNGDEELNRSLLAAHNYWPIRSKNGPLFRANFGDDM